MFRENDIGTIILATITDDDGSTVDLSGATNMVFVFKKPNGDGIERNAVFNGDGSDGIIKYQTVDGDLTPSGLWHFQAFVNISDGDVVFHSAVGAFEVASNLGEY